MPYLAFASAAHCFSCGVRAGAAPEVPPAWRPLAEAPLAETPPADPLPEDRDVPGVGVTAALARDAGTLWVATPRVTRTRPAARELPGVTLVPWPKYVAMAAALTAAPAP